MDGLVNWKSMQAEDSDRFSQGASQTNKRKKTPKSFEAYLKKKEIRDIAKKAAREKATNPNKKILEKELLTT